MASLCGLEIGPLGSAVVVLERARCSALRIGDGASDLRSAGRGQLSLPVTLSGARASGQYGVILRVDKCGANTNGAIGHA
jgi:hypothetical protein